MNALNALHEGMPSLKLSMNEEYYSGVQRRFQQNRAADGLNFAYACAPAAQRSKRHPLALLTSPLTRTGVGASSAQVNASG